MPQWVTSIPMRESVALHAVLQKLEMELLPLGEELWLRGEVESAEALSRADRVLRTLPNAIRYRLVDANLLQPIDRLLPTRTCPEGSWLAPRDFLTVALPSSGLAGTVPDPVSLRIVRASSKHANSTRTPTYLECSFADFQSWALQASETRLSVLAFACDQFGNVVVHGSPLPPLQGIRWIVYDKVAIPVGHSWQPAVSQKTLNQIVQPDAGAIHFLSTDDQHHRLELSSFVKATRSGVRETAAQLEQRND